jgi:hypothetical protein
VRWGGIDAERVDAERTTLYTKKSYRAQNLVWRFVLKSKVIVCMFGCIVILQI